MAQEAVAGGLTAEGLAQEVMAGPAPKAVQMAKLVLPRLMAPELEAVTALRERELQTARAERMERAERMIQLRPGRVPLVRMEVISPRELTTILIPGTAFIWDQAEAEAEAAAGAIQSE